MSEPTLGKLSPNDKRPTLIGKQFNRLQVIGISDRKEYVICRCECGNTKEVRMYNLWNKRAPVKSCGCLNREQMSQLGRKNGLSNIQANVDVNLRHHTNFQIIEKTTLYKNNKSGKTGVWWNNRSNKWLAYIRVHNKQINLGTYSTFEDAVKARLIAEDKYFKPLIEAKHAEEVVDV